MTHIKGEKKFQWAAKLVHATLLLSCSFALPVFAQVNSGSNGSDGAFDPTTNEVINMADHPDGIYNYTSVNIPTNVSITFIANENNTPVTWLVQGNCAIRGTVNINGQNGSSLAGASGGPGGYRGGNGSLAGASGGSGIGPGGGQALTNGNAANASHGTPGDMYSGQNPPGPSYGTQFLIPLLGGSGGCGGNKSGGGGGGGAILIAATNIVLSGSISASGGAFYGNGLFSANNSADTSYIGGGGSGGAIRLIATSVSGSGALSADGGQGSYWVHYYKQYYYSYWGLGENHAGFGRVRIDALSNLYNGSVNGLLTIGYQPIIIVPPAQAVSLAIQTVAGIAIPAGSIGSLTVPDVIIPGNQQNPVPIIIQCTNLPMNTQIVVDVTPSYGTPIRAVGVNNIGSQSSSTATVQMNLPRGGGVIQVTAVSAIGGILSRDDNMEKFQSLAQTGWSADGERFASVEVTASLGGKHSVVYLTESGKRYPQPSL